MTLIHSKSMLKYNVSALHTIKVYLNSNYRYKIMIAGGVLMGLGVILLIIKCAFFRKPIYDEDDEDEDEIMAEKEAAAAIEKKCTKSSAEAKHGESSMLSSKHPHLSITITPASDPASLSPIKCSQQEIETCTNEEVEALTSNAGNGCHEKSSVPSAPGNDNYSDNRNNIQMQPIKTSVENKNTKVTAKSAETSSSKVVKHAGVPSKNRSAV